MKLATRQRIARVIEKWLLVEPLLLAIWTSHALISEPRIQTIRVQRGRIEYNPRFIEQLGDRQLEAVLRFEALRILLKHPYSRRQAHAAMSYAASNLTLQEYLQTELPFPRARDLFGDASYDRQFFEFYYQQLLEQPAAEELALGAEPGADSESLSGDDLGVTASKRPHPRPLFQKGERGETASSLDSLVDSPSPRIGGKGLGDGGQPWSNSGGDLLGVYAAPALSGAENTEQWGQDELLSDRLDDLVRTAQANESWGSIGGRLREQILANLYPKLDYRAVLRQFRTSILSQQRRLTRMKPNRRYGFTYMGSRRDFTTKLLFAIDVSGSMGTEELQRGFSVVNRFFNYGVPTVDVLQFDAEITAEVMTLRRAQPSVELTGRGGTNFSPVLAYVDEHRDYDGLIIYTDGYAPCPKPPRNRRTRVLWLFVHEEQYQSCYPNLKHLGQGAYLRDASASGQ
jgi:predicted metal-dependent peptidase